MELTKPNEALQVASTLQTFVTERKLTANIQGKNYPLVEAWQFAGSQLGLIPVVKEVKNLSTDTELKYEAFVEVIRLTDGVVLSRGYAVCSNKENSKRRFDEYAIASMAQTRAVGKAYRNILAWLMKAAGFEATPAEEMDFVKDSPTDDEKLILIGLLNQSDLNETEYQLAMDAINSCQDYKTYQRISYRLESRVKPIDQIPNPNQKDINNHLKKSVK
jgi:hypothetical protein